MKNILKKSALLCAFWLMVVIVVNFVKAEPITIPTNLRDDLLQRVRLHTLHLWDDEQVNLEVVSDYYEEKFYMDFGKWLVVWKDSNVSSASSQSVVIGWWEGNRINLNSDSAGIGGWRNNNVFGNSAVIGWGYSNTASWTNSVVLGWDSNVANAGGVVVGWKMNTAYQWGVILWWNKNKAAKNSLALWSEAESQEWAFWWNGTADENSAYINATNWTLVGTYDKISGVNLVVGGAVKIKWKSPLISDAVKWEIRSINGCLYAYDGNSTHGWHVITRWDSTNRCGSEGSLSKSCVFGNTFVWEWDIIDAYPYSYVPTKLNRTTWKPDVTTCTKKQIICHSDGILYEVKNGNEPDLTKIATDYYPYCYNVN